MAKNASSLRFSTAFDVNFELQNGIDIFQKFIINLIFELPKLIFFCFPFRFFDFILFSLIFLLLLFRPLHILILNFLQLITLHLFNLLFLHLILEFLVFFLTLNDKAIN
jgi:hypothetical protein